MASPSSSFSSSLSSSSPSSSPNLLTSPQQQQPPQPVKMVKIGNSTWKKRTLQVPPGKFQVVIRNNKKSSAKKNHSNTTTLQPGKNGTGSNSNDKSVNTNISGNSNTTNNNGNGNSKLLPGVQIIDVLETSTLLGRVQVGDRIITLDGKTVHSCVDLAHTDDTNVRTIEVLTLVPPNPKASNTATTATATATTTDTTTITNTTTTATAAGTTTGTTTPSNTNKTTAAATTAPSSINTTTATTAVATATAAPSISCGTNSDAAKEKKNTESTETTASAQSPSRKMVPSPERSNSFVTNNNNNGGIIQNQSPIRKPVVIKIETPSRSPSPAYRPPVSPPPMPMDSSVSTLKPRTTYFNTANPPVDKEVAVTASAAVTAAAAASPIETHTTKTTTHSNPQPTSPPKEKEMKNSTVERQSLGRKDNKKPVEDNTTSNKEIATTTATCPAVSKPSKQVVSTATTDDGKSQMMTTTTPVTTVPTVAVTPASTQETTVGQGAENVPVTSQEKNVLDKSTSANPTTVPNPLLPTPSDKKPEKESEKTSKATTDKPTTTTKAALPVPQGPATVPEKNIASSSSNSIKNKNNNKKSTASEETTSIPAVSKAGPDDSGSKQKPVTPVPADESSKDSDNITTTKPAMAKIVQTETNPNKPTSDTNVPNPLDPPVLTQTPASSNEKQTSVAMEISLPETATQNKNPQETVDNSTTPTTKISLSQKQAQRRRLPLQKSVSKSTAKTPQSLEKKNSPAESKIIMVEAPSGSLGLKLSSANHSLVDVYSWSPIRTFVQVQDQVLSVDGIDLRQKTLDEVTEILSKRQNQLIRKIEFLRPGTQKKLLPAKSTVSQPVQTPISIAPVQPVANTIVTTPELKQQVPSALPEVVNLALPPVREALAPTPNEALPTPTIAPIVIETDELPEALENVPIQKRMTRKVGIPGERLEVKKAILSAYNIHQSYESLKAALSATKASSRAYESLYQLMELERLRRDNILNFDDNRLTNMERAFKDLVKFKMNHGHLDVPSGVYAGNRLSDMLAMLRNHYSVHKKEGWIDTDIKTLFGKHPALSSVREQNMTLEQQENIQLVEGFGYSWRKPMQVKVLQPTTGVALNNPNFNSSLRAPTPTPTSQLPSAAATSLPQVSKEMNPPEAGSEMKNASQSTTSFVEPKEKEKVIDMEKSKSQSFPENWNVAIKSLERFREVYGHCYVPSSFKDPRGTSLNIGAWVLTQQEEYDNWLSGRPTSLNVEQVLTLRRLGVKLKNKSKKKRKREQSVDASNASSAASSTLTPYSDRKKAKKERKKQRKLARDLVVVVKAKSHKKRKHDDLTASKNTSKSRPTTGSTQTAKKTTLETNDTGGDAEVWFDCNDSMKN